MYNVEGIAIGHAEDVQLIYTLLIVVILSIEIAN